jgi:polyphosphate glucokinase
MDLLGIDIGGSGIKGAPVNIETGELTAQRHRIPTPQLSTPEAVAAVVAQVAQHFSWKGPIGCTFPAIVRHGVVHSAANVARSWIGTDGQSLIEEKTGCPVVLLNDADAAGVAEMSLGAGKGKDGVVFMITLGTGIGSAVFLNGELLPNTELGHLYRGKGNKEWEGWAAERIRQEEDLSWKKWAKRVNQYLLHLEFLFSPDLFIIGGGVSKKHEKFLPRFTTRAAVVPAQMRNEAGIIGAAMAARGLL